MISFLYFDLGGVVFEFHPDNRIKEMSMESGISEVRLQMTLFDSGFADDCDAGLYSAKEMHIAACERLDWRPSYREFQNLWASAFVPSRPVMSVARRLSRRYRIGLLTNNPPLLREVLSDIEPDMETIFHPILFSGELKVMKPASTIFHHTIHAANCPAEKILFIDDSLQHLEAAQQVGLNTIHFTTAAALVKELQGFGIQAA